jgi:hypothetical protein
VRNAKQEAGDGQQKSQETIARAELVPATEATKAQNVDWMRALERRAVAADRIAETAQLNVGRALGAFHKMADFGLAAVNRDQGSVSKLEVAKKLLVANRASVKKYGVQIVREKADSQHLDVLRYSFAQGTESGIKEKRDAFLLETV